MSDWLERISQEENLFLIIIKKAIEDYLTLPPKVTRGGKKVPCQDWLLAEAFILERFQSSSILVHPETQETITVQKGEKYRGPGGLTTEELVDLAGIDQDKWKDIRKRILKKAALEKT